MMQKILSFFKSWNLLLVIGILAAGGMGLFFWAGAFTGSAANSSSKTTFETFTIKRGNLAISVSGTGTVITDKSVDLGFPLAGKVDNVVVQLGDRVSIGQTLATLDGIEALKVDIENKQLVLQTAQKNLEDLKANGPASLAQALADQAQAQSDYQAAKNNLHARGDSRCAPSKISAYFFENLFATGRVNTWQSYLDDGSTGYGANYILTALRPMKREQYVSYVNLKYCEGYTDQEILTSQANLSMAEATLQANEKKYQDMVANSGLIPQDTAIAEAEVKNAELQVALSRNNLENASIVSPIDGTVTVINGTSGQTIEKGIFLTVTDLDHPIIKVNIDQSDLQSFVIGSSAQVTFDALPARSFSGTLTQILPIVASLRSANVVQGLVVLENGVLPSGKVLPVGLNANVEITLRKADNVLIIPIQSLYQPAAQSAYVVVVNSQGNPEKREVEVGLKATAFVEILNGLKEGERVITRPISLP